MKALRVNDMGWCVECVECVECVVCVLGVTSGGGRSQSCGCCSISRPSAQSVDPGGGRRSSHVMFCFGFFLYLADDRQLPHRRGDDAVQHHGQQLLAAGGGHLPPQPAGHHRVHREELLQDLPVHRLG